MPTNTPQQLRIEINLFIEQVRTFHHHNCHSDINKKLESINHAHNLISEINGCHPVEIPFRIIALRRLLVSLLPHTGYREHIQLSNKLDAILNDSRLYMAPNVKRSTIT